jgi:hypothetical protein
MIVEKASKKTQQFDIISVKQKQPLVHYNATAAILVSVIAIQDILITTVNKLSGYP